MPAPPINFAVDAEAFLFENTTAICMGRVYVVDGSYNLTLAKVADFAGGSISYQITMDGNPIGSGALTPASVILDVPSSGSAWKQGGTFNFVAEFAASLFSVKEKVYIIDIKFVAGGRESGAKFKVNTVANEAT